MTRSRSLTALLAILAMTAGGVFATASPARATDRDDMFRFLLGAATIAIIVHSYEDHDRPQHWQRNANTLPDQCIETLRSGGRNIDAYNAQCLREAGFSRLPMDCRRAIRTDRGTRSLFSAACLFDAGYRAEGSRYDPPRAILLPLHCEQTYRLRGQRFAGYAGDCLAGWGFRHLPQHCAVQARSDGRPITLYNARCLERAGYVSEAGY